MLKMGTDDPSSIQTRPSLLRQLRTDDNEAWNEFYHIYGNLARGFAIQAGLTATEAEEVVQETVITVAKKIDKLRYDPALGSFKGWLLQITRWRIADQFRKRDSMQTQREGPDDDRKTATIERLPDLNAVDLDVLWEREWQENLLDAAIVRVKKKVDPKQFQIFDCYVRKEWPAQKVAAQLRVSVGQVYLARHRVSALIKKEVKIIERYAAT